MTTTYTYYQDPGHGWIKATKAEINELGIAEKISHYSYEYKDSVYLEEDLDAQIFIEAYKAKHGKAPELKEVYQERTPIRNYNRYEAPINYPMIAGEGALQYTFDVPSETQLLLL